MNIEPLENLPTDKRDKASLAALKNIITQSEENGFITSEEIESTIEAAWQTHK